MEWKARKSIEKEHELSHVQTPHIRTHTAEKYTHTPLFISSVSQENIRNLGSSRIWGAYAFNPLTVFTHTLAHPYRSTKLKQLDLLREPSTHLLRRRAFKNDCFNQRREKQQVTDLTAILVCPSLPLFS